MNESPLAPGANFDEIVDQFEQSWQTGDAPRLSEYLSHFSNAPDQRRRLLAELVAVDLEYRWRLADILDAAQARPEVEAYLVEWPELGESQLLVQLVAEEYRARHRWADRPAVDEYLARFTDQPTLPRMLESVRQELVRDEPARETRVGSDSDTETDVRPGLEPAPPTAERLFGRYRLRRLIGQGGMGEVFLAEDTQLERLVALKIPRLEMDVPHLRARFINEAKAAATLRHPGICPVFDAGEIEGQPFLTMAYIEGETLRERWLRRIDDPAPDAAREGGAGDAGGTRRRDRSSRPQAGQCHARSPRRANRHGFRLGASRDRGERGASHPLGRSVGLSRLYVSRAGRRPPEKHRYGDRHL